MTLLMRDQENIEKGIEKGIEQGEEKMLTLIEILIKNKRFDDIEIMKDDIVYRQKLYKDYGISV